MYSSLYIDLPKDGDLITETCRRVQAYVWLLISVMCVCWYKWMIYSEYAGFLLSVFHQFSVRIFTHFFVLPEEETYKTWDSSKNKCSFGNRRGWYRALFLNLCETAAR